MLNSGYSLDQTRTIVVNGLNGYERKIELYRVGKAKLHRTSKESNGTRYKRKILSKTEWFS